MPDDQVFHTRHGIDVDTIRERPGHDPLSASRTREADHHDRLHWLLDHLPASRPGRPVAVLDLGCAEGDLSLLLVERGDAVTGIDVDPSAIARARLRRDRLPADVAARMEFTVADGHGLEGVADAAFNAAALGELLDHVGDPVQLLGELHRTLRPGAALVFTVPYGAAREPGGRGEDAERRRIFYHGSLRHLVEPLFEIRELTVLRRHLAGVAVRRDEPRGTPGFALSRAETAFLQRERALNAEIDELRTRCADLAACESTLRGAAQDLLARNAELRAEAARLRHRVTRLEGRLSEYRQVIARLRRSRAWRVITAYRRLRYPTGRDAAAQPATKRPVIITGSTTAPRPALPEPPATASRTPAR
ncbi:hypothetical protein GCM10022226_67180 [Sphaerisporangium flaviroseum]|uniref:Methyltransferase type 11 domain-containing protein n=1 Tax=Sphaerisporangium flaviroseum TaxID=509199 RepID=A0ABP7J685_9ACTN